MMYDNDESVKSLRLWMTISGLVCIFLMTALIFLQQFLVLAYLTGFFLLALIIISLLDFKCIRISESNGKLIIRYYSVFTVNRNYQSIEIPLKVLCKIRVNKFFFGLKWNLRLTVLVPKGVAEYPPVSLSAVPFSDRSKLIARLTELVTKKE